MMLNKKNGIRIRLSAVLTAILLPVSLLVAVSPSATAATTNINWWCWNCGATDGQPYMSDFEAANPGIKVTLTVLLYAEYKNALRLAVTTGSGPDVFGLQVGALTDQYASSAEDLAPYFAKSSLGANWKTKMIGINQLASKGKQVGAPFMITAGGLLWYNKDLFDKYKVVVPTDLASFKAACAKFRTTKVNCFVQGAKDSWVNLDMYQAISNQIVPGEFYDSIVGKKKFDSLTSIKAFETWKMLFTSKIIQKGALATPQYMDAYDSYMKGESAMIFLGSWQNPQMTKTAAAANAKSYAGTDAGIFEHLAVPFPAVVKGGKTGGLFGGPDVGWAMSNTSKVKDAAWKFIEYLTIGKGQVTMGKSGQQPANSDVPLDTSDMMTAAQKAVIEMEAKALSPMIGQRQIPNADVEKALGDALSAVAAGTISSRNAAKAVQAAIKKAYKL